MRRNKAMGILTYLRQKTDKQKKIFSLVSAAVLTVIIVGSYFSLTDNLGPDQVKENEPSKLSSVRPLQMIKEEFSKVFSKPDSLSSSSLPVEIIEATTSESEISTTTTN